MTKGEFKYCASCGRVMQWRKAWTRNWSEVRYCSEACRRAKISDRDRELEKMILSLLAERRGSICPSDAARAIDAENWRDLMESTRRAARRLVISGDVIITQQGRQVDASTAKGAIRIQLAR